MYWGGCVVSCNQLQNIISAIVHGRLLKFLKGGQTPKRAPHKEKNDPHIDKRAPHKEKKKHMGKIALAEYAPFPLVAPLR